MRVSDTITIQDAEIDIQAVRSQGAGGQNVNKVATAVHLRFDIRASSLPDFCKTRLLKLHDRRITKDGVIVIKAQQHRSQEKNRQEALNRLQAIVQDAVRVRKARRATRPTAVSRQKRLEDKARRSRIKSLRRKVDE
ncbi:MAG: aminoacyl-tRNA hydrolase [Chlorobiales bacterium]|nr:aminoacyl-tRNA hydrolase [Chlorobiales bacterium]